MRSISFKIIGSFILLTALFSCSNKIKQTKYIPKDSSLIFNFNPASLSLKAGLQNIMDYEFAKELKEKSKKDSVIFKLLENPLNLGVDLLGDVYGFIEKEGVEKPTLYIIMELNSKEDFQNSLSTLFKNETVQTNNSFSYYGNANTIISWNDEVGVISFTNNYQSEEEAKLKLEHVYNLAQDQNINNIKEFSEFTNEDGDINMFISQESFYAGLSSNSLSAANASLFDNLKGIYSTAHVNFNDNNIEILGGSIKNEAYLANKEKYENYILKYNAELNNILPKKHLAILSFAFNTDALADSLNSMPIPNKQMLTQVAPVLKGFGGSFCLNFSDVNSIMKPKLTYTDTGFVTVQKEQMIPEVSLGFDIKDYNKINPVLMMAQSVPTIIMQDNYFIVDVKQQLGVNFYFCVTEKFGIISTNEEVVKALSEGEIMKDLSLASSDVSKNINEFGNYFNMNLNINEYPSIVKQTLHESVREKEQKAQNVIFNFLKGIEIKTINNEDFNAILSFQNKEGNILQNFLEIGDEVYKVSNSKPENQDPLIEVLP